MLKTDYVLFPGPPRTREFVRWRALGALCTSVPPRRMTLFPQCASARGRAALCLDLGTHHLYTCVLEQVGSYGRSYGVRRDLAVALSFLLVPCAARFVGLEVFNAGEQCSAIFRSRWAKGGRGS